MSTSDQSACVLALDGEHSRSRFVAGDSVQIHVLRMRQLPTNPILAALAGNASYRVNRRISKGLTVAASPGTRPIDTLFNHPPDSRLDTSPVISNAKNAKTAKIWGEGLWSGTKHRRGRCISLLLFKTRKTQTRNGWVFRTAKCSFTSFALLRVASRFKPAVH